MPWELIGPDGDSIKIARSRSRGNAETGGLSDGGTNERSRDIVKGYRNIDAWPASSLAEGRDVDPCSRPVALYRYDLFRIDVDLIFFADPKMYESHAILQGWKPLGNRSAEAAEHCKLHRPT